MRRNQKRKKVTKEAETAKESNGPKLNDEMIGISKRKPIEEMKEHEEAND